MAYKQTSIISSPIANYGSQAEFEAEITDIYFPDLSTLRDGALASGDMISYENIVSIEGINYVVTSIITWKDQATSEAYNANVLIEDEKIIADSTYTIERSYEEV